VSEAWEDVLATNSVDSLHLSLSVTFYVIKYKYNFVTLK
jgi:hypothetical protein